jgi:hypothetical protein
VTRPEAGIWTVSVSGSGIAGLVVQARTAIGISDVQFAPAASANFTAIPSPGVENIVKLRVGVPLADVHASLVNGVFTPIARLPLELDETDGSYRSHFTPGSDPFRLLIVGKDGDGNVVQRVHAPLMTATR